MLRLGWGLRGYKAAQASVSAWGGTSVFILVFITPFKDTNSTPSRSGAPAPGGGVPSERPWATQRPRRDEQRAPRTLGVAPVARLPQQARASVPWVAPQLQAHVQPGQLVRAFGRGPPPHAGTQHRPARPPCTARPTRCVPHPSQAVRWSWHCCAPRDRARGRLRAGHVARVEHAETAGVRPWAALHRPAAPGRCVAPISGR